MTTELDRIAEARDFVRARADVAPRALLMLGSGLGSAADALEEAASFALDEIPHFPRSTVEGHSGSLAVGTLHGLPCLVSRGRFHLYEGYTPEQCARPVRLARALGAEVLIVTNAAGGIADALQPGDLMLITDHLNLTGRNVLIGPNDATLGPRFPDMSSAYDAELRALALEEADAASVPLREGVYAGLTGPAYETPAEIRMLRTLGADAVGMSTVTEVIAAVHAGMRVLGVSCITNKAAGLAGQPLSHDEVLDVGRRFAERNRELVGRVVARLAASG